jgi:hypothetical protein
MPAAASGKAASELNSARAKVLRLIWLQDDARTEQVAQRRRSLECLTLASVIETKGQGR